jgi:glycolate dehydrogenase iron-sulfur subunit
MLHEIVSAEIGVHGQEMADQVKRCVHCGFCLPVCPTYRLLGEEMDSPRGRIFLMKEMLEGKLPIEEGVSYIDQCLGCLACVPACPSGVSYGDLLTPFRIYVEGQRRRDLVSRASRFMARRVLPFPARFRAAVKLGGLARLFNFALPDRLKPMLALAPRRLPPRQRLPEIYPPNGRRRARVALLSGCVQTVLAPEINWATLRVLARNGVEVVIPRNQACCGSLGLHCGEEAKARSLARTNLEVFPLDVDAILTNAAGCGSGMKEYPLLFKGTAEERLAADFAHKVQDVAEFLDHLGLESPPPFSQPLRVAYHDACHLRNAQGVIAAPRRLLGEISNLTLLEVPQGELCCGSAGTYSMEQPSIASKLGEAKASNILHTHADIVAAGNIGCIVQIKNALEMLGKPLSVLHTVEILDAAYSGVALHG